MSDPRMVPADDAQVTLDVVNHAGGYGFSFHDTYVRDLAYTVVRLREELEALRRACIESAEVSERNAKVSHVPEIHEEVAETERDTADIITRILEGGTDE